MPIKSVLIGEKSISFLKHSLTENSAYVSLFDYINPKMFGEAFCYVDNESIIYPVDEFRYGGMWVETVDEKQGAHELLIDHFLEKCEGLQHPCLLIADVLLSQANTTERDFTEGDFITNKSEVYWVARISENNREQILSTLNSANSMDGNIGIACDLNAVGSVNVSGLELETAALSATVLFVYAYDNENFVIFDRL